MRGKKSYNIRNIEAHIHNFSSTSFNTNTTDTTNTNTSPSYMLNKNMAFHNNQQILTNQQTHQTQLNEYINAKYGVSKYASNLVSGKMFKNM